MKTLTTILAENLSDKEWTLNNINCGGCGKFALNLHDSLQRIGIHCSLISVSAPYWNYEPNSLDVNKEINNIISDKKATCPNDHIVVKVGNVFLDSNGDVTEDYYQVDKDDREVFYDLLEKLVNIPERWNRTFTRSNKHLEEGLEQVMSREIKQVIQKSVSQYENILRGVGCEK